MIRSLLTAAVLSVLLTACGGGDASVVVQVPERPPPQQAQDDEPPAPRLVWAEDWSSGNFGGTVAHVPIRCDSQADPGTGERFARITGRWGFINEAAARRAISLRDATLRIDYPNHKVGIALLSAGTFSRERAWRLEAPVTLEPDDGAWIGLTLIHGEGDYREISLYSLAGRQYVRLYAPCYVQTLAEVPLGARLLRLDYLPGEGWRYWVDDSLLHVEPMSDRGADLVGDARVGIYVVNVHAEARMQALGTVRARVGKVNLYQLDAPHTDR